MKKIKNYALIALAGILLTSCIGRAIGPDVGESRGSFTADIDGNSWRAQDVEAVTLFGTTVVTGERNDGSIFSISFLGANPEEGVYELPVIPTSTILGGISYASKTDGNETVFNPTSGTLEITRFRDNQVIEGKFEFEGTDFNGNTVSIENGKFDVTISL